MENSEKKGPLIVNVKQGRYAWCMCGLSKNFPHCDGSHKTTDIVPIGVIYSQDKTEAICTCGNSKNKPFCDGSHRSQ